MKVLFTFPGQGPQRPAMLHDLPDNSISRSLIEQASVILNEDVLALDSASALQRTLAVQ